MKVSLSSFRDVLFCLLPVMLATLRLFPGVVVAYASTSLSFSRTPILKPSCLFFLNFSRTGSQLLEARAPPHFRSSGRNLFITPQSGPNLVVPRQKTHFSPTTDQRRAGCVLIIHQNILHRLTFAPCCVCYFPFLTFFSSFRSLWWGGSPRFESPWYAFLGRHGNDR